MTERDYIASGRSGNNAASVTAWKIVAVVGIVVALVMSTGLTAANSEPCAERCRANENACRVQTKGASQCVTQFNACMQSCMATLAKPKK